MMEKKKVGVGTTGSDALSSRDDDTPGSREKKSREVTKERPLLRCARRLGAKGCDNPERLASLETTTQGRALGGEYGTAQRATV